MLRQHIEQWEWSTKRGSRAEESMHEYKCVCVLCMPEHVLVCVWVCVCVCLLCKPHFDCWSFGWRPGQEMTGCCDLELCLCSSQREKVHCRTFTVTTTPITHNISLLCNRKTLAHNLLQSNKTMWSLLPWHDCWCQKGLFFSILETVDVLGFSHTAVSRSYTEW